MFGSPDHTQISCVQAQSCKDTAKATERRSAGKIATAQADAEAARMEAHHSDTARLAAEAELAAVSCSLTQVRSTLIAHCDISSVCWEGLTWYCLVLPSHVFLHHSMPCIEVIEITIEVMKAISHLQLPSKGC